jgi:DNA primase
MQDAKEEVRSKLAIEDVIGEYVQLKRSGRYWRGLSPFTNEKTPSFFVTPERDIWHDFSSNQGGDVFSFIEQVEGVGFREALEILARKAGVDLTQYDSRQPRDLGQRKNRILAMNTVAVNYFQRQMTQSKTAIDYIFKKRSLSKDTVVEWGIGFAPEDSQLKQLLAQKGYADKEIREAGLIGGRGGEMFRSRMMVPLRDGQGQVVGFTGRIIGEGEPKYLNTPATILYDKGRQVFGLNFAKNAIREADFSVIVEGNLDVVSSHQAGVKNVVACAGTALTRDHLKSLSRLSRNANLSFDGDRAGLAATERAIALAEPLELKLSVVDWTDYDFPEQATRPNIPKDPDEIIAQYGAKTWQKIIKEYVTPAVEWVIKKYAAEQDLTTADGKKELTSRALKLIKNLRDAVEVEFYLKELAALTGVSIAALEQKMYAGLTEDKPRRNLKQVKTPRRNYSRRDEQFFLNLIFAIAYKMPLRRTMLRNLPDEYLTENLAKIKYWLLGRETTNDGVASQQIITTDMADKLAELELIAAQEIKSGDDGRQMLLANMAELEKLKLRVKFESLSAELANVLEDGDGERARLLNGAVNGLKKDLTTLEKTSLRDDFAGLFAVWDGRKSN